MTTYDGNPASYPDHITIPDDGGARSAASVNVPFEGTIDRTAWLKARHDRIGTVTNVTTVGTNTFTTGPYDTLIRLQMCGGGGGGGGGGAGQNLALASGCGGGGGGGAPLIDVVIPVFPSTTYEVVIGDGGAGGPGNDVSGGGTNGSVGGMTKYQTVGGATVLAIAHGGGYGRAGTIPVGDYDNDPTFAVAPGGGSNEGSAVAALRNDGERGSSFSMQISTSGTVVGSWLPGAGAFMATSPGDGGDGFCNFLAANTSLPYGRSSTTGMMGGAAGATGTDDTTVKGGGPGGGGGAGPFSSGGSLTPLGPVNIVGGDGGDGGAGSGSTSAGNATNGTAGLANTGGGGGGGGGGGSSLTTKGHGGDGGKGGSGRCRITVIG